MERDLATTVSEHTNLPGEQQPDTLPTFFNRDCINGLVQVLCGRCLLQSTALTLA